MAIIPKNYHADDDTTNGVYTIYGYPKYFKNDQDELQEVDTRIVASTRPGYDYEVTLGVYKLYIKTDPVFIFLQA